jgi:hypothetical protein
MMRAKPLRSLFSKLRLGDPLLRLNRLSSWSLGTSDPARWKHPEHLFGPLT